jgi:RHS repeat-associated protein
VDELGAVRSLRNGWGEAIQWYSYDAFGRGLDYQIRYAEQVIQPYGLTGREWDSETGLYSYRAKYYDSRIGGFISQDRLGLRVGM